MLESNIMSKSKKKNKITPSQQRYNQRVPTTSFRLDPDTVKKLNELREASNPKTWKNLFKGLVGDYELKLLSIEEARKAGYKLGFRNAWSQYAVSFPCADCGQTIYIEGSELKAKVRKLLGERLAHEECPRTTLPKPTPPKPPPSSITLPKPNPPAVPVEKSANQDKISRFLQG
jgi:hypothetical protein